MASGLILDGRRRTEIDGGKGTADWEAIRAEYIAGSIGQRALARRHGVSCSALNRRAVKEGWAREREQRAGAAQSEAKGREAGNAEIAARLHRKLLMRLEKVTDAIPDGAVTETKAQVDNDTRLFKLRDLTAAYKDLAGELPRKEERDVEDLGVLAELLGEDELG